MRRLALASLLACVAGACGISLSGTGSGASFGEGGAPEAGTDAGEEGGFDLDGGAPDDVTYDVLAPDAPCPETGAPAMIRLAAFCIDATEVTVGEYQAFLAAAPPVPQPLPPECAWNTDYTPDGGLGELSDKPVFVDWCDAWAYCKWAGKRLCGRIDTRALALTEVDKKSAQWFFACSAGGTLKYPYGNSFDPNACPAILHPSVAGGACQGGFPGIFDMSGNAWEWIDSCESNAGNASCAIRGGSYTTSDPTQLACAENVTGRRNEVPYASTGFRCCAP